MPVFPRLQHGDDGSVVGSIGVGEKIEAAHGEDFLDARNGLEIRFSAPHQLVRTFHGSAVRKVEDREEVALVFVGNEAGRQLHQETSRSEPEAGKTGYSDQRPAQEEANARRDSRS